MARSTPLLCIVSALLAARATAEPTPVPAADPVPVIDAHTHTGPERYEILLDILAANGITRFVNLSGGSIGRGLEESLAGAEPFEGRVAVCANVSWRRYAEPDFGAVEASQLAAAAALGARCLKVSKALGLSVPSPDDPLKLMAVDDRRLDPIWAAAGRLGLPVYIHTGDPRAFFEPATPDNERYDELSVHPDWSFADPIYPRRDALLAARDRVLERHPGTTFIGVHFANNPEDLDYVERVLTAHPNLYIDIAARVPEIGRHDPAKVRALFIRFQDRILFGTDLGFGSSIMLGSVGRNRPGLADLDLYYADIFRFFESNDRQIPHPTPIQGNWRIDAIGLPRDVRAKLYAGNALKLLWGEPAPGLVDAAALSNAPNPADFYDLP